MDETTNLFQFNCPKHGLIEEVMTICADKEKDKQYCVICASEWIDSEQKGIWGKV